MLMKYQDVLNKDKEMQVISGKLHNIMDFVEHMDFKNGVDLHLNDDGYKILVAYGQLYSINEERHMIITAMKVLPYNEEKQFLDLSDYILTGGKVKVSNEQFEDLNAKNIF